MRIRATLKDVAEMAGVSVSTVSRVSSNHPDVSEETRHKVHDVMRVLNYHPDALARSLVLRRSNTIGLMISDIANPFYSQLAAAIEEVANQQGYVVFLCNTGDVLDRSREYINMLLAHGVEGIIHASIGDDEQVVTQIVGKYFPLVFVNRRPVDLKDFDVVAFNSVDGARQAARHLLDLGHTDIAFLSGPLYVSTERDRLAGFMEELNSRGISVRPELIHHIPANRQIGYKLACNLLDLESPPTAFLANDIVAFGVFDAARDRVLSIPDDLSIIGFGAIEWSNYNQYPLTTISSRIKELGRKGFQRLSEIIAGEYCQPQEIILDVGLIDHGTTAPPSKMI